MRPTSLSSGLAGVTRVLECTSMLSPWALVSSEGPCGPAPVAFVQEEQAQPLWTAVTWDTDDPLGAFTLPV